MTSTWLNCDSCLEDASWEEWGTGSPETAGRRWGSEVFEVIRNVESLRAWDRYPVSVVCRGEEDKVKISEGKKALAEWRLKDNTKVTQVRREVASEESWIKIGEPSEGSLNRVQENGEGGEECEGDHINNEKKIKIRNFPTSQKTVSDAGGQTHQTEDQEENTSEQDMHPWCMHGGQVQVERRTERT